MKKMRMTSPDLVAANIEKLAALFPQVITESADSDGNITRAIDFDLLRQELSDHLVEGPQERFRLEWPGKRAAALAANAPIAKTLRPVRKDSVNFDTTENLFIEGDNLEALKLLQESYLGKVKLIYIDPPYNTGTDLIYDDDFSLTLDEYLQKSGQIDDDGARLSTNRESNGRFHSDWLSMIYPRLRLARNLLKEDGVIFVSIDDNEFANLRRVMDEVFGAANFFAELVVVRSEGGGLAKRVVKGHDYLLVYARNIEKFEGFSRAKDVRGKIVEKGGRTFWIETDWLRKEFGKYGTLLYSEIEAVRGSDSKNEIDQKIADGQYVLLPKGDDHVVGRLRDLAKDKSKFHSVLKHLNKNSTSDLAALDLKGVFDHPKPVSLVEEIVMGVTRFSKNERDIVLDFFAGSGTTADAVYRANARDNGNRRFICVQIDQSLSDSGQDKETIKNALDLVSRLNVRPVLSEIAKERIRRAGSAVCESLKTQYEDYADTSFDYGFRSLRVDKTNMNDVFVTPDEMNQSNLFDSVSNVKTDRTGEDLLFQVLLDWGLPLDVTIEVETIEGQECFVVENGALIACFEPSVSPETVRSIAKRDPVRAVFRDEGFATDAERINAEQVFKEFAPSADVKVI